MDCNGTNTTGDRTSREQPYESNELSQETKESCKQVGRLLARFGDMLNVMYSTRNGHNVCQICPQGGGLRDAAYTRPRSGLNKLP